MRHVLSILLATLSLAVLAPAAGADVTVTEVFYVDPFFEPGGYYELSVSNSSGQPIYAVIVFNNEAQTILVKYPELVGIWSPNICTGTIFDDCPNWVDIVGWTPPDLTSEPIAPGYSRALVYYVRGANPPIADGETLVGLRWLGVVPDAATPRTTSMAGSPFMVYNGEGDVVAEGFTTGGPLPTEPSTWGAVKALYR